MNRYDDIIKRLEQADGPSRELDLAIGEYWPDPKPFSSSINQQRGGKPPVFRFTDSLDASIALVERLLPGWRRRQIKWRNDFTACIWNDDEEFPDDGHYGRSSHEPIALLIAFFRALNTPDPVREEE